MFKTCSLIFIFLCGNQLVSAQEMTMEQREQELVAIYQKVESHRFGDFDSLTHYSNLFSKELVYLIERRYNTINYPFKLLTEEHICTIATSKDGLFRIYSWDTQTGGTMRFFNAIYQYKQDNQVYTDWCNLEEGDPGHFYSEIFALKVKRKTVYLGIANGIYSTKDVSQSIKGFELTQTGINDSILLMKTSEGLKNSLDLAYDFFSVVDRPERPVAVIKYDTKKKIISISMTNEKGEVMPGYTSYQFNGSYFETKAKSQNAHSN